MRALWVVPFLASGLLGQGPLLINSAGPATAATAGPPPVPAFQADQYCTGSRWTPQTAGYDPGIGTGIWADLLYGSSFVCDIPLPLGSYRLVLDLEENRAASLGPALVGPGTRVFTVSANGATTGPLDLFLLAGAQRPYQATLNVVVTDGHLRIQTVAAKGNAVLSAFEVYPVPVVPVSLPVLTSAEAATVSGVVVAMPDGTLRTVTLGPQLAITFGGPNGDVPVLDASATVANWMECKGTVGVATCDGVNFIALNSVGVLKEFLAVPAPGFQATGPKWTPAGK